MTKLLTKRTVGLLAMEVCGSLDAIASHSEGSSMTEPSRFAELMRHSVLELILTSTLLFGVTTIVRFVVGPSPLSRAFPQIHVELLIVGAGVALLLTGLIKSPLGKISGGHMNPAISLAMWRFGVFPTAGILLYVAAQLLGSVFGVVAGRAIWGRAVEQPPVLYAAIQAAPGWSAALLFLAEAVGMGVIVLAVGYFLSVPQLAPFVPWLVGILIGLGIAMLGTQTGGSLNPARQFGPALVSGQTDKLWVFLLAPMVGAELAARLLKSFQQRRQVLTHRLCGTQVSGAPLDDRRMASSTETRFICNYSEHPR
jgi:glycerol uptake facilitator protein/aquaporin Z